MLPPRLGAVFEVDSASFAAVSMEPVGRTDATARIAAIQASEYETAAKANARDGNVAKTTGVVFSVARKIILGALPNVAVARHRRMLGNSTEAMVLIEFPYVLVAPRAALRRAGAALAIWSHLIAMNVPEIATPKMAIAFAKCNSATAELPDPRAANPSTIWTRMRMTMTIDTSLIGLKLGFATSDAIIVAIARTKTARPSRMCESAEMNWNVRRPPRRSWANTTMPVSRKRKEVAFIEILPSIGRMRLEGFVWQSWTSPHAPFCIAARSASSAIFASAFSVTLEN